MSFIKSLLEAELQLIVITEIAIDDFTNGKGISKLRLLYLCNNITDHMSMYIRKPEVSPLKLIR